jgi:hypothetical protein
MVNNLSGSRKRVALIGLTTSYVAAMLAAAVFGGLCLPPANDRDWRAPSPATTLAAIAVLGVAWLSRARAVRRLKRAMDTFAEREIARARRRKRPKEVQRSW